MPSRNSTRAARSSGIGGKTSAPTGGLFFGGTQLVQNNGDDKDDDYQERDQSYLYDSDADEDDGYAETSLNATKKRRSTKKSGKKGKTAIEKALESDFDSDDKTIIEFKQAGYKDDVVAKKLVDRGGQQLTAKTIGTRWLRLKKKVEQKEEDRLDDNLSDWHIGEDEKLRECFNVMEAKYEVEMLKLKERKWKEVSAAMADALRIKKYTPKACKERWESLEDGTALLPIELDADPKARKVLREARVAENMRRREEQKAAVIWALGEKDRKAAQRRAIMEQREVERQAERAKRQAERDEDARIKAEQRAGLERKRAEQRAIEDAIKAYHEEKRNERKNADAMYMYYTGKKLNGRRDNNLLGGGKDDETVYSDSDIEMADSMFSDDEENEPAMPDLTDAEEDSVAAGSGNEDHPENIDGPSRSASISKSRTTKGKLTGRKTKKPKVTLETLINPRSIMSDAELAEVLARRSLARRGRQESHPEVVARLAAADAEESLPKIKELLAAYFERRKGTRETLVRRLQEYDAASSNKGMQSITAIDPEFKKGYEGYRGKFAHALDD